MIQFNFVTFVLCLVIAYHVSYFPANCIIFTLRHFILLDILIIYRDYSNCQLYTESENSPIQSRVVDMLQFEVI